MEKDSGTTLTCLAVDGGMSNSDTCMQIQADIMGIEVDRPAMRETTALGAAIAAGFAAGVWKDLIEMKGINKENRTTFVPHTEIKEREKLFEKWTRAVDRCRGWIREDDEEDESDGLDSANGNAASSVPPTPLETPALELGQDEAEKIVVEEVETAGPPEHAVIV